MTFFPIFWQVHLCSPNVDWFITLLLSVPAKGHDNALSYVMSEWTRQQGEHSIVEIEFPLTIFSSKALFNGSLH